jgi:hypothetical protein
MVGVSTLRFMFIGFNVLILGLKLGVRVLGLRFEIKVYDVLSLNFGF